MGNKLSLSDAKKLVNANVNDHEEKLIENDEESYGYTSFAASLLSANEYWQNIKNEILESYIDLSESSSDVDDINENKSSENEIIKDKVKKVLKKIKKKFHIKKDEDKEKNKKESEDLEEDSEEEVEENKSQKDNSSNIVSELSQEDEDAGSVSTDEDSINEDEENGANESKKSVIAGLKFKKPTESDINEKTALPKNAQQALNIAKEIMKGSDGLYATNVRNHVISVLDALMKSQSSESTEEKQGFLKKFKSKLKQPQSGSKLNSSIKKLKSRLQSLYEEYPPIINDAKSENSDDESEKIKLNNNDNIMKYAIKSDFLNDAEKSIRDALSEVYVLEKSSSEKGDLSSFSSQGKNAIVVLSTLLRQENNEEGAEENSYAYQYNLMRKIISVKKESSSSFRYSSKNKSEASFEKNIPAMRVLGIALKCIIDALDTDKNKDNVSASMSDKIKKFAKIFSNNNSDEIKSNIKDDLTPFINKLKGFINGIGGKYAVNSSGTSFKDQLVKFLDNPTQDNATSLFEACTKDGNIDTKKYIDLIYSANTNFGEALSNDSFKKLFYTEDPKNDSKNAAEEKKKDNKEAAKK